MGGTHEANVFTCCHRCVRSPVSLRANGSSSFIAAAAGDTKPAQPAPPKPEAQKPFSELTKDSKEIPGLFHMYRTDEKLYLEIRPDQFDKLYMLSLTCDSGIGERGVYAAAMCGETPVVFHRIKKNTVQLIARNTMFRAQPGTPMARAVEQSFSDSVMGNSSVVSLPHPERNSLLIDLGSLLLTDMPMFSYELEVDFRLPYRFDPANSTFGGVRGYDSNVEIETIAHYAAESVRPFPALTPGSASATASGSAQGFAGRPEHASPVPLQPVGDAGRRLPPAAA